MTSPVLPVMAVVVALGALAACDSPEPPVATTISSDGASTFTGVADAILPAIPAIRLVDQRGRGLGNVVVRWRAGVESGSTMADTVRTDADGVASSGGWRLGTRAGTQTLTATVSGLAPVTFSATVGPAAASLLERRVPEVQSTRVNSAVAQPPSLTVFDAFRNPVAGVSVQFFISSGTSTVEGPLERVSDADGVVTLGAWRIGTSTSEPHVIVASAASVPGAVPFRVVALGDTAVLVEAASAAQQEGVPRVGVSQRPSVRARDQYGNPAGGVTVVFMTRSPSGSVLGGTRVTADSDGLARVSEWILGDEEDQELVAVSPRFPADTFVFRARAVPSVFDIQTVFLNGEPSPRNRQAVETAVARWRNVIAGEVPAVSVFARANECGPGVPSILNEQIANVRIFINFAVIDGEGGVLGRAGPCIVRAASGIPVVGFVELDAADLADLDTSGVLEDVMTHEIGHVLGLQRFTWGLRGLLVNAGSADPHYQGLAGRDQFAQIGGGTYTGIPVPLENTGGGGTRDSHWRTSVLRRELMVGFAQPGGMPLSRLTVGALSDLGYLVRPERAESFVVPSFGSPAFGSMYFTSTNAVEYHNDEWPSAIYGIDEEGRRRLLRAGDWRVTRGDTTRGGGR